MELSLLGLGRSELTKKQKELSDLLTLKSSISGAERKAGKSVDDRIAQLSTKGDRNPTQQAQLKKLSALKVKSDAIGDLDATIKTLEDEIDGLTEAQQAKRGGAAAPRRGGGGGWSNWWPRKPPTGYQPLLQSGPPGPGDAPAPTSPNMFVTCWNKLHLSAKILIPLLFIGLLALGIATLAGAFSPHHHIGPSTPSPEPTPPGPTPPGPTPPGPTPPGPTPPGPTPPGPTPPGPTPPGPTPPGPTPVGQLTIDTTNQSTICSSFLATCNQIILNYYNANINVPTSMLNKYVNMSLPYILKKIQQIPSSVVGAPPQSSVQAELYQYALSVWPNVTFIPSTLFPSGTTFGNACSLYDTYRQTLPQFPSRTAYPSLSNIVPLNPVAFPATPSVTPPYPYAITTMTISAVPSTQVQQAFWLYMWGTGSDSSKLYTYIQGYTKPTGYVLPQMYLPLSIPLFIS